MLWLGVIASLCYVPGITGAYIATQWPLYAALLPFALFRKGPFTIFHVLGSLFLVYAALLFARNPLGAEVMGLWLLSSMALFLWLGSTLDDASSLYKGLAIGGAVSSFVGVLQIFGVPVVPSATGTPAGIYVNSVQQGTVLALLVVALWSEELYLWSLPLFPGLLLAQSRGAWVALVIGVLALYVRKIWVFVPLAFVGMFFLLHLSASDSERMYIWQAAWKGLTWLGWGPGMFFVLLLPGQTQPLFPEYAHNDALQLAFEYGVGSILPLAIFVFALSRRREKEWPVIVAFATASCYSMPLYMPLASFLGLVAVGRVLREYAVHGLHGSGGRLPVLSWWKGGTRARGGVVPVASHNFASRG